jgi:hypothetical protein
LRFVSCWKLRESINTPFAMKKIFILSMIISSAVISSCQKQDSVAEAQLAQRKTELDVREEALVEREKAVEQREKAVLAREKALASNPVTVPQSQVPDAAQAEAERQRRIQQLPPELRALVPDRSRIRPDKAEKNPAAQPGAVRTQRSLEDSQKKKMLSGAFASPAPEVPQADASSPSPSPTP